MEEKKKVLIAVGAIGTALALAIGLAAARPVKKVEIIDLEVERV